MRFFDSLPKQDTTELFRFFVNADLFLILAESFETNDAVFKSKESIVFTATYVHARMDLRSSLPDENVAREDELTVSALGSEPLRRAVSSVSRTTYALLVSEKLQLDKHIILPPHL